jgi:hypothetical protein
MQPRAPGERGGYLDRASHPAVHGSNGSAAGAGAGRWRERRGVHAPPGRSPPASAPCLGGVRCHDRSLHSGDPAFWAADALPMVSAPGSATAIPRSSLRGGAPAGRPPFPTTPARKKFVLAPAAGNCAWLKLQKQEQPQEMQKGQKGQKHPQGTQKGQKRKQTQKQTQEQTQKQSQKQSQEQTQEQEHTAAAQCRRRTHWLAPAAACGLAVALRLAAAQIYDHGLVAGNGIWQPIDYFS